MQTTEIYGSGDKPQLSHSDGYALINLILKTSIKFGSKHWKPQSRQ